MPQGRGRSKGRGASDAGERLTGDSIRTALISGNTFQAKAVQYTVVDGLCVFEGDIILGTVEEVERTTEQIRAEMTGQMPASIVITGSQFRWPDCRVPFTIDAGLPNQARVTDAIAHWEANTGFRFVARTSEPDFVTFRLGTGCSSMVGRRGGQQFINLAAGCDAGRTIHEIGHAIGFWHEQSREDRDAFVTIHWDKIQAGMEHNFNQHVTDGDDVGAYDYGSIMHYERDAFSIDGSDTITPTDPAAVIGQRIGLSPGDIASANILCPITLKEGPIDTLKETVKDLRLDTRKELVLDTAKELTSDTIKEQIRDTRKEQILDTVKEQVADTVKEQVNDTIKEQLSDTVKEQVADTVKEQVNDTIKEGGFDPTGTFVERVDPFGGLPGPVVQPGFGLGGAARLGGGLPFAMATPHQAPGAPDSPGGGAASGLGGAIAGLDARLVALAEEIAQLESASQQIHAQYQQLADMLAQAVEEFQRTSRG